MTVLALLWAAGLLMVFAMGSAVGFMDDMNQGRRDRAGVGALLMVLCGLMALACAFVAGGRV